MRVHPAFYVVQRLSDEPYVLPTRRWLIAAHHQRVRAFEVVLVLDGASSEHTCELVVARSLMRQRPGVG